MAARPPAVSRSGLASRRPPLLLQQVPDRLSIHLLFLGRGPELGLPVGVKVPTLIFGSITRSRIAAFFRSQAVHANQFRAFAHRRDAQQEERDPMAARSERVRYGFHRTDMAQAAHESRRGPARAASSSSRRLSFSTGVPISCRRRGSTGIITTGCLRRITRSGPPSRRWPSGLSASGAMPRPAGMGATVTPREAAVTRVKIPARTTPHGLPGRS